MKNKRLSQLGNLSNKKNYIYEHKASDDGKDDKYF